jgi:MSHA biogenesis protein MshE
VVEMTPQLAVTIQRGEPSEFERLAREQIAGYTMERNAYEMVLAGSTTIAEAMKVSIGGEQL